MASGISADVTIPDIGAPGFRLPTEAEWLFAARGGMISTGNLTMMSNPYVRTEYPYSGGVNPDEVITPATKYRNIFPAKIPNYCVSSSSQAIQPASSALPCILKFYLGNLIPIFNCRSNSMILLNMEEKYAAFSFKRYEIQ